jgi:hypothetical protein
MATKEQPSTQPVAPATGAVKPFPQTSFITEKRGAEPAPPPSDK